MKSIKNKVVGTYLIVIIITVVISEIFLISAVKEYYYNNAKQILSNDIKSSAKFYNTYLSSVSLKENIKNDVDIFWKNVPAEVQILDVTGHILMDSIGYYQDMPIESSDFKNALSGELGMDISWSTDGHENILNISYPLKSKENIEGVLRFIASLKEVDKNINKVSSFMLLIGLLVITVSGIVSTFIANAIVTPIKTITDGAEKMASGNFNEKIPKISNDELGNLTDTLNYMSKEILKNDKLKNEFIASISHELRTPLTSIKGWAIALSLCDPNNKTEFEDGLKIIEQESDRLSNLVEDLLDFSKLVSGKIVLKKDLLDVNSILVYMKKQLTPKADRDKINLILKLQHNLPKINADRDRLKQLFMNILDNSFKFTSTGGIIKIISKKFDNKNILIKIIDNGCGISKEDLPRVTEKFYKGSNTKSKNGIGLSICSEIVVLHGGNMKILSTEGKGTEIQIFLPIST